MLTVYINAAMQKAHYEILPDNESYSWQDSMSSRSQG